ncbi:hypothetical protein ACIGJO_10605 [Streptomyces sp. NPDC079020]|uniref:hypothetical protein n=1 Tax=Streptomyces sp. NPDC079020 TaxID=3365722 RepID=UPI0037D330F4
MNTLPQKENAQAVRQILDYALARRLHVQFIELVGTDFNEGHAASAVPADDIIAHLRTLISDEHTEVVGFGQGRKVFRVDGIEIDVIHRDLGRHHVGQCGTCPVRASRETPPGSLLPDLSDEDHRRPEFCSPEPDSTRHQVDHAPKIAEQNDGRQPLYLFVNVSATHGHYLGHSHDTRASQQAALAYADLRRRERHHDPVGRRPRASVPVALLIHKGQMQWRRRYSPAEIADNRERDRRDPARHVDEPAQRPPSRSRRRLAELALASVGEPGRRPSLPPAL